MKNPSHLQHIGKMIRDVRNFRVLTQDELADKAQVRQATISDIEKGKLNFEINTLVRIASALNCYLDVSINPVK